MRGATLRGGAAVQTREVNPLHADCGGKFTPAKCLLKTGEPGPLAGSSPGRRTVLVRAAGPDWTGAMRRLAFGLMLLLVCVPVAAAEDRRLGWPLKPRPAVVREFDAPDPDWRRGHRGVDLAGSVDQPVYAAAAGTVVFAGRLVDRPVVSIEHPGGLRTSYEPVEALVRPGQRVDAGTVVGTLVAGHSGCGSTACLHWGAMWGRAADARYVDPLGLLASTPIRLKPLGG